MTSQPGEEFSASSSSSSPSPRLRPSPLNGQTWILLLIALAFVAATRLLYLGERVFYHDESLFAFYAWQLATTGTYTAPDEATPGAATDLPHHPLLHGPLQMQLIAGVFYLARLLGVLGDGDAAARLLAALSGIALLFPILALRRQIHRQGVVFAAAMAAVSPGIWYYSRFCRNEAPFLLVTLTLVVVVSRGWRSRRPVGWIVAGCLLVAMLVALKENSLFILFDGVSFLALLAVFDRRARATGSSADGLLKRRGAAALLGRSLSQYRYAWISGLALAWLLLEIVYTNGFQWPRSFLGMYVEQMKYWWGQHAEQRIHGEFHYHLPILALYEPLAVLVLIVAVGRMLRGG
ncbi:MAG TPA: flippase activity-associated protein Agl23, partial [Sumerlaeia bacterium]|nr:flippase activity-associated protein Agl23 [Sumerlaeia bacterium]